jgi:predicted DNA-binding transcriptional regulator YafY
VTALQLKEQLADAGIMRDLRTIQRLLKALCERFDIDCDYEKPHGYKWKPNASGFSVPAVGAREALLLALAKKQLDDLLPASVAKSLEPYFLQADRVLGPTSKAWKEREWLRKVRVISTTQPLLPPNIANGVLEAVSDALYGNLWLTVDYANASGGRNKCSVTPLGLAQQGPRLYLVCRFEDFGDYRILAVHRIKHAKVSTRTFERPADFDLEKYADDGQFGFGNGRRVKVSFHIPKNLGLYVAECRLSQDQTMEELDSHYRVTATVVQSILLDQWLDSMSATNISKFT